MCRLEAGTAKSAGATEAATTSETTTLTLSLTLTVLRALLAKDLDELLGRESLGELGIVLLLHLQTLLHTLDLLLLTLEV